jgi:hypothetical protein
LIGVSSLGIRQRSERSQVGPSAPRRDAFGNARHIRIEYRASDVELLRAPVVNRSILDSRAADKRRLPSASLVEWAK